MLSTGHDSGNQTLERLRALHRLPETSHRNVLGAATVAIGKTGSVPCPC
jgi:hypothetical protein